MRPAKLVCSSNLTIMATPNRGGGPQRGGQRRGQRRDRQEPQEREFDQKIIDLARVTRVMAGGKRMRFRACVVIGDHQGRVAVGVGKGADVSLAISKATAAARKELIRIPLHEDTLPHEISMKFGAAKILLKPAPRGTGIIAGGAVRSVLDLGGVPNVVAKMLGSRNKLNNARATVMALKALHGRAPKKTKEATTA
jgi:small subunit ribosomal protein S5